MTESEIRKIIDLEVKRQLNVILSGSSGSNDEQSEDILEMFPGMAPQNKRPLMHPFGFVSRAPSGIIQVIGRFGEHFGNRFVLGHRDKNRPKDLSVGESTTYSIGGYRVTLKNSSIMIGKNGDFETAVVGETLITFLKALISELKIHQHITSAPGAPTSPPTDAAQFTQLQSNFLDNDKILAKDGGRF